MTDRLDFEARLEDRLRARAAIATRPFDAAAIAHQAALAGGRRRLGGTLRLTNWSRLRSAAVGLLVLGLVAAGIAAGSRLLQREAPVSSDSPISTTTPVLPSATPQASVVPVAGRIVYTRWKTLRDGEEDCTALFCHRASVNIANDDGSNEQELVPGPYAYLLAASPAGPTVLVRRRDADGDHAYLTDVSGSPLQRLETDCGAPCGEDWYGFTFSPDGTRLAWVRSLTDERPVIAIMDMSTGVVVQLASTLDIASRPGWSPDGSRLVFANQIVDADGGNLHQFAPNDLFRGMEGEFAVSLAAPQWSPDGSLIAFVAFHDRLITGNSQRLNDIYVVHPDGTGLQRLTMFTLEPLPAEEIGDFGAGFPTWTRDGRITFSRYPTPQEAPFELWVMDRDGNNVRQLDPSDAAALTALGCVSCAYPSTGGIDLGLPAPEAFWVPAR